MINRQTSDNKPCSEYVVDRPVTCPLLLNENWPLDVCLEHKIVMQLCYINFSSKISKRYVFTIGLINEISGVCVRDLIVLLLFIPLNSMCNVIAC